MKQARRSFIAGLGSLAAASMLPPKLNLAAASPLYPPIDPSCFDRSITPAPAETRFGYAAITWGGNDTQAARDISEVGFRGIQLRANVLKDFNYNPKTVAELLHQHKLQFVALSGGGPSGTGYIESEVIATQVKQAAFLKRAGGLYLQMTDSSRPKDRKPTGLDFKRLGRVLTEAGKRAVDLGVRMAYHNHMGSVGEGPEEVDAIMEASDERYVKLLLDVAHYTQGGGDPARAIRKYRDRILFLHIKDVASVGDTDYQFVELGRGRVDLPAVFAALKEIKFRGWAIVELDRVPDQTRTPKESAIISKKYIEQKLQLRV